MRAARGPALLATAQRRPRGSAAAVRPADVARQSGEPRGQTLPVWKESPRAPFKAPGRVPQGSTALALLRAAQWSRPAGPTAASGD